MINLFSSHQLKKSSFGLKQWTSKPVFTMTLAQSSIDITVIGASTAQALTQARGSEDAYNTSKSVRTRRTRVFVLLAFGLTCMLMPIENLLL